VVQFDKKTTLNGRTFWAIFCLVENSAPYSSKELAEASGGLLTWLGVAVIVAAIEWLIVSMLHLDTSNWRVWAFVGAGGSTAWAIARLIERRRRS
jgi:hypothetical protein